MPDLDSPVVARTRSGAVRGRQADGVAVFLGIPFAAAPVGDLRFQAPTPPEPWDGVREADAFGPPPPQMLTGPAAPVPAGGPVRHGPDDWLTVNVWTPDATGSGLPVLVWIYGGAYRFGWSGEPFYDGRQLAGTGAVVVTGNHRLGMDGYASLTGAPENRALLDQAALLRWVQENIAGFGGDPGRVTVFGESAGAGGVASLLATPACRGLFSRAIVQSLPGTFFTPRLARDIAAELVAPLGRPPVAQELATVDAQALAAAAAAVDARMGPAAGQHGELADRWGPVAGTITPFSPVVDGEVLPVDPWTALTGGAARDVDVLVGHNRDEWRLFLVAMGLLGQVRDADAEWALATFGPASATPAEARAAYGDADAEELFTVVQSDWLFRMPSVHLAAAQAAGGGRSHLYELTWPAPAAGGVFGACHSLDVPLVFGTLRAAPHLFGPEPTPDAEEVSARMRATWVAFANSGDPGWAPFDAQQRSTGVIGDGGRPTAEPYPEEASRALWERHRFAPLELGA